MEDSDPIADAIAPPRNESAEDREARIQKERAAKLVSDAIDAELTREHAHEKKRPKPVKILLLGSSPGASHVRPNTDPCECRPKRIWSVLTLP
jgi:guanine nucleotide-binding protein subunit alpha